MDSRKLDSNDGPEDKPKDRLRVHTETHSDRTGFSGWFERFTRRFKRAGSTLALMPLVPIFILVFGASIYPGILIFRYASQLAGDSSIFIQAAAYSFAAALAYILFAGTIMIIVPLINFLLPLRVKQFRGNWYSWEAIPWYYHNALVQFVRYTVLDMFTPTPINVFFYRMMGMKVGKNCIINTTNISDPCLIELGDYVTIGGSATIFAHYGQGGFLIVGKTKIGSYSTVGLKASVMGNVVIGERCVVGPHVAVLPKTVLKDGERILK